MVVMLPVFYLDVLVGDWHSIYYVAVMLDVLYEVD